MRRKLLILPAVLLATRAHAECAGKEKTEPIPLPVWATDPNEGSTYGVMPVFIRVCEETNQTEWILAPSVTWNSLIELTGTVRFYDYPAPDTSLSLIASASLHVNYAFLGGFERLPSREGAWTDEATVRLERSIFTEFYGLGPDTSASAESSYTGERELLMARRGLNLPHHLNLGLTLGFEHDEVGDEGVPNIPSTREVFPDVPGMDGAVVLWQGLDLRYDDRKNRDYADVGVRLDLSVAGVEGLSGSPSFVRAGIDARGLWPELSWLSGAARFAWTGVTAPDVPFYLQSELGGPFYLRGFNAGRFFDRMAWTLETEQRIRILQTHLFGVTADWRVDPFVTIGQVYGAWGEIFSQPQIAAGLGFRAFIHPNLLARVDVATGGEGLKVYVEIGYPY